MRFLGRIALAVLGATVLALGFCVLNLRCSGDPEPGSSVARVADEIAAGKREARYRQAEDLARLAHDLRVLAKRYKAEGENRKAQRAIGAAQELDKKIRRLRASGEETGDDGKSDSNGG